MFTSMVTLPRFIKCSILALLLSTSALAMPAYALDSAGSPPKHRMRHEHPEWSMKDHTEARIKALHDALNVTQDQESNWADVAQVMRNSEANIDELIKSRHSAMDNATAIDNLKSYQVVSQAHADAMSKFIDTFESFYDDLTPEQKQKADTFFKNGPRRGMTHGMPRAPHKKAAVSAPAVKVK